MWLGGTSRRTFPTKSQHRLESVPHDGKDHSAKEMAVRRTGLLRGLTDFGQLTNDPNPIGVVARLCKELTVIGGQGEALFQEGAQPLSIAALCSALSEPEGRRCDVCEGSEEEGQKFLNEHEELVKRVRLAVTRAEVRMAREAVGR